MKEFTIEFRVIERDGRYYSTITRRTYSTRAAAVAAERRARSNGSK